MAGCAHPGGSSNGRTSGFGPENRGSNPCPPVALFSPRGRCSPGRGMCADRHLDVLRGGTGVLMFPYPHDCPASPRQRMVISAVAGDVARELRLPVCRVCAGVCGMDWAAVPEASIHEDSQLNGAEDDVGTHPTIPCSEAAILAKPQSPHVQRGAQESLRVCVRPTIGLHCATGHIAARQRRQGAHFPGWLSDVQRSCH